MRRSWCEIDWEFYLEARTIDASGISSEIWLKFQMDNNFILLLDVAALNA